MFSIETRYQYWGREEVTWSKWFVYYGDRFKTKEEAETALKAKPKRINKLKYECRIVDED